MAGCLDSQTLTLCSAGGVHTNRRASSRPAGSAASSMARVLIPQAAPNPALGTAGFNG